MICQWPRHYLLFFVSKKDDAAKAMVEYCHQPDKGMNLYRFANKQLDKMQCNTGCGNSRPSCSSC